MNLEYSPRAQTDLLSIFSYLNERSPQAALAVIRDIREQIETLLTFPFKGTKTNVPDTRRLKIARRPYVVIYRLRNEMITVAHIRHTSRQPWRGEAG